MNVNPRVNLAHNVETYTRKKNQVLWSWQEYMDYRKKLNDRLELLKDGYDRNGSRREGIE